MARQNELRRLCPVSRVPCPIQSNELTPFGFVSQSPGTSGAVTAPETARFDLQQVNQPLKQE